MTLTKRENELGQLEAEQEIKAKQRELEKAEPLETRIASLQIETQSTTDRTSRDREGAQCGDPQQYFHHPSRRRICPT